MDLRIHSSCPVCGSDMSLAANRLGVNKAGTHAQCRPCRSRYQLAYARANKTYRPRSARGVLRVDELGRRFDSRGYLVSAGGTDHTEAILRLVELRERCATHWERAEVTERIEALQSAARQQAVTL